MIRVSAAVMGIEFAYAAETAFVSPTLLGIGIQHRNMTLVILFLIPHDYIYIYYTCHEFVRIDMVLESDDRFLPYTSTRLF